MPGGTFIEEIKKRQRGPGDPRKKYREIFLKKARRNDRGAKSWSQEAYLFGRGTREGLGRFFTSNGVT